MFCMLGGDGQKELKTKKKKKKKNKEPQYFYVYENDGYKFLTTPLNHFKWKYIGKIKLEVEDD